MLHKLKRIDMEAKDLRIGSWVNYKTENIAQEICSIQSDNTIRLKDSKGTNHGCYRMSYVEPIPLTEEWFDKLKVPQWFRAVIGGCDNSESYYINISFLPLGYLDIKYVHQLQNLYYALTGEELTIKK